MKTYVNEHMEYVVADAVAGAADILKKSRFRLEAPAERMNTEFQMYVQGRDSIFRLYYMLWKTFPSVAIHLIVLLLLPLLLFFSSIISLLIWMPNVWQPCISYS